MSEPFLAEIKLLSFGGIPQGWAACNGQFMPINQNQALFALLGTTFGGNGQTTFALPDFRGRIPIHVGGGHNLGEKAGTESVTLTISNLPTHTHILRCNTGVASTDAPAGNFPARATVDTYGAAASLNAMNAGMVQNTGGSQPHLNMMPYLALTFVIALQGIFPPHN